MIETLRRVVMVLAFCALSSVSSPRARAQASDNIMSNAEVDALREAAYVPTDRIAAFIKILDARSKSINAILTGRRKAGRDQQLHDIFDQFSGIADELNDNLDDYAPKHRDIRKSLPKLLEATERWSTTLRAAPEDASYNVVRKIALDSVRDVHDAALKMQEEQLAFFKAHPEAAKAEADRISNTPAKQEQIDIPR